ncbi:hypothetical protein OR571_05475 [Psychrobacillus sp. NEAU-3TGS]|uniref:hypothetical protein n=1 Tax=Psychrobacillus sp. NEAU-3TGS TaxID=2995412 RepID=UPI002495F485|nr:hypothetical protein [Psychrobacillus sp. NEAU-3TGS]MDI2586596.1 hypothetical protein [Psychrobacillus sp. NEAU-3TGS]
MDNVEFVQMIGDVGLPMLITLYLLIIFEKGWIIYNGNSRVNKRNSVTKRNFSK